MPILARWPAIARFLHANRERVATLISPTVSALCEKWLISLPVEYAPGFTTPFRKEFGEVALATARALQLEQKKETIFVGDFGKAIYPAALAAAPDLPDQVSAWALEMSRRQPYNAELKTKIAEYRQRKAREHEEKLRTDANYRARFERRENLPTFIPSGRRLPFWPLGPQGKRDRQFSECCTNQNALTPLMRARPKVAAEVLLATIIEDLPEESYGNSRFDEGFGLEFDMRSYPTAYWKSPFFLFLQIDSGTALETLIALVNFCTERWAAEYKKHWSGSPPELAVNLPDSVERKFVGDTMMFIWSQTNSTHTGQLTSALAALERYLVMKIEAGLDVVPDIQRVLLTGASVGLIGVLTNIGKCKPDLFRGILRPLVAHSRIYFWDDERIKALPFAFAAQWAQQGDLVLNMARNWYNAPYRSKSMREVVRDLVKADSEFAAYVNDATAQWRIPDDPKSALEVRILAAQLDSANYRAGQDGADEFVWPAKLARDIHTFQSAKASTLQILQLPDECRQFLNGGSLLNAETAQALAAMLDAIDAETGLEEEFKARASIATVSALLVKGSDWLNANPLARDRAWEVFRTVLAAIPARWKSCGRHVSNEPIYWNLPRTPRLPGGRARARSRRKRRFSRSSRAATMPASPRYLAWLMPAVRSLAIDGGACFIWVFSGRRCRCLCPDTGMVRTRRLVGSGASAGFERGSLTGPKRLRRKSFRSRLPNDWNAWSAYSGDANSSVRERFAVLRRKSAVQPV